MPGKPSSVPTDRHLAWQPPPGAEEGVEAELARFVELGTVLDKRSRRYLAHVLHHTLDPSAPLPPDLDDAYARYFARSIERIFSVGELLSLCRSRPRLARQVTADALTWMRRAWRKAQERNPWEAEFSRLGVVAAMPLPRLVDRWPSVLSHLESAYSLEELDVRYHRDRLEELLKNGLTPICEPQVERVVHDLLQTWDAVLTGRLLDWQLRRLEEELGDFQSHLEAKEADYRRMLKLLTPFTEYVGRYWDLSREALAETTFDVLEHYEELLADEENIRRLADMLGRMREAELQSKEEVLERVVVRERQVVHTDRRAEIVGVRQSSDLASVLPAEVAFLADADTEDAFWKRFADSDLQTWRWEHTEIVSSPHTFTEVEQRTFKKERGPFIVCIDTSDSMAASGAEPIAKVLAFAICRMAAHEDRKAYLINFSTGLDTLDLYDIGANLDELAHFLTKSFNAGTDVSLALWEALRMLRTERYRDADVLVVSDFIMYTLSDELTNAVRHQQQNAGTAFHALTLYADPHAEVTDVFDTNWLYDPVKKGVVQALHDQLEAIRTRPT